jgi:putative peptidoglycan lipid II flippase
VPAFYALKDTRLPVVAAFADMAVFLLLGALLARRLGLPGIGLASSCAAAVNVAVLVGVLRRREGRLGGRAIAASLARVTAASVVMGVVVFVFDRGLGLERLPLLPAALALAVLVAAATAAYWLVARWLGCPEPSELARLLSRKRA